MNQPFCIELRAAISTAVSKIGFSEAEAGKIEIALDEALTNIIRHGYDGDNTKPIWLRFKHTASKPRPAFQLIIDDSAKQVDPSVIKGRDLDDVKPGGLGVNIIHAVMDSVDYAPRPEGGMRLTLNKTAADPDAPDSDSASAAPPDSAGQTNHNQGPTT